MIMKNEHGAIHASTVTRLCQANDGENQCLIFVFIFRHVTMAMTLRLQIHYQSTYMQVYPFDLRLAILENQRSTVLEKCQMQHGYRKLCVHPPKGRSAERF